MMSDTCSIIRVGIESSDPIFDPIIGGVGGVIAGIIGVLLGILLTKYCCFAKLKSYLNNGLKTNKQHMQDKSEMHRLDGMSNASVC